jgi:hypothetical protein
MPWQVGQHVQTNTAGKQQQFNQLKKTDVGESCKQCFLHSWNVLDRSEEPETSQQQRHVCRVVDDVHPLFQPPGSCHRCSLLTAEQPVEVTVGCCDIRKLL